MRLWIEPVRGATPPSIEEFRSIGPQLPEIAALVMLSFIELLIYLFGGYRIVNFVGPISLIVVMGASNWWLARRFPAAIWTPTFAFRLGTLVFFGIGGLLPYIVKDSTLDYLLALYPFTPAEAAKANLVWAFGTTVVVLTMIACNQLATTLFCRPMAVSAAGSNTVAIGFAFLAIGLTNSLIFDIGNLLGVIDVLVPGTLHLLLDAANSVGLFLISFWALERGGYRLLVVVALIVINSTIGLLALNKTLILLPLLFVGLAVLVHRFSLVRAAVVGITLMAILSVLQPMVANGRILQAQQHASPEEGTVSERAAYYVNYIHGDRSAEARTDSDEALVRLSYVNVAVFVIDQFDRRLPDTSIANAGTALIPRVIWPNKPIITQSANELYFALTGNEGSAVSATVYPDVYWNYGWVGIAMLCPLMGVFFLFGSRICYSIIRARDWIMMPFVLINFRIGISMDGPYINAMIAPMIMSVVLYFVLRVGELVLTGRATSARADHGFGGTSGSMAR